MTSRRQLQQTINACLTMSSFAACTAVVMVTCLGASLVSAATFDYKDKAYIGTSFVPSMHLNFEYSTPAVSYSECCKNHTKSASTLSWVDWRPVDQKAPSLYTYLNEPDITLTPPPAAGSRVKYMVLMIDALVGQPLPGLGSSALPFVQWQVANIDGAHVRSGDDMVSYLGTGSRYDLVINGHQGSGPIDFVHKFYFLLYRQSGHISKATAASYSQACPHFAGRCLYDIQGLVKGEGLTLVGVGGYSNTLDSFARSLTLQRGLDAAVVCDGVNYYSPNCQQSPIVG